MTYAIGYAVYGINLKNSPWPTDVSELEESGLIESHYHGNAEGPTFVGVCKKKTITECSDEYAEDLLELLTFSEKEKKEAWKKIKALIEDDSIEVLDEFKDWLKEQNPKAFLTWGSS